MSTEICSPIAPPTFISNVVKKPIVANDQEGKAQSIIQHFSHAAYQIPGMEKGELMEEEKIWLSYECVLRYATVAL
jgi:hypothetical protein